MEEPEHVVLGFLIGHGTGEHHRRNTALNNHLSAKCRPDIRQAHWDHGLGDEAIDHIEACFPDQPVEQAGVSIGMARQRLASVVRPLSDGLEVRQDVLLEETGQAHLGIVVAAMQDQGGWELRRDLLDGSGLFLQDLAQVKHTGSIVAQTEVGIIVADKLLQDAAHDSLTDEDHGHTFVTDVLGTGIAFLIGWDDFGVLDQMFYDWGILRPLAHVFELQAHRAEAPDRCSDRVVPVAGSGHFRRYGECFLSRLADPVHHLVRDLLAAKGAA